MPRKVRALQDLWAEGRAGIQFSVLGILLRSSSVALSPSQEGDKALPQTHRDVAGGVSPLQQLWGPSVPLEGHAGVSHWGLHEVTRGGRAQPRAFLSRNIPGDWSGNDCSHGEVLHHLTAS